MLKKKNILMCERFTSSGLDQKKKTKKWGRKGDLMQRQVNAELKS